MAAKMLMMGSRTTMRPVTTVPALHRSTLLPSTKVLRAAVLAPYAPPSGSSRSLYAGTATCQLGPDIFADAQVRTPKVVAINTAALGVELHGQDDTVAAVKAVRQAFETISVPSVLDMVPGGFDKARAKVKVAVPYPRGVDVDQVKEIVPFKNTEVKVVRGGLSWNSGVILPKLGDPPPEDVTAASSDDEEPVTSPDEYKVAVAAVRVGY